MSIINPVLVTLCPEVAIQISELAAPPCTLMACLRKVAHYIAVNREEVALGLLLVGVGSAIFGGVPLLVLLGVGFAKLFLTGGAALVIGSVGYEGICDKFQLNDEGLQFADEEI